MSVTPLRIEFSDRAIKDLHRRLDATRWPDIHIDQEWEVGTNDSILRNLVSYWRKDYDWFHHQRELNRLAHIRVPINSEELHAVLYTGPAIQKRVPILLIHGWPGSFIEFLQAAPLLQNGSTDFPGYDVVVPSLPGFGFSDQPNARGMHPGEIAERLHGLMQSLGYEQYCVQGGDWGAIIGSALSLQHPEAVLKLHLNFMPASKHLGDASVEEKSLTVEERLYLEKQDIFRDIETGYSHIQSTRPQSLSYALHDSPVGLLGWILEKYWVWSDHDEDLWGTFERDSILTNVMIYWLTGTILSASRIYYEAKMSGRSYLEGKIEVPTAYTRYPKEPWTAPISMIEDRYNLVRFSEMDRGGHFAAFEQPELFAGDVGSFFADLSG